MRVALAVNIDNEKIMKNLICILSLLSFMALSGCGSLAIKMETEAPDEISTESLEGITEYATKTINCKEEEFSYQYSKNDGLHYMKGCGEKVPFSFECVRDQCFWINLYTLEKRAKFELDCKDELEISKLAIFTWGIAGCGKRAAYEMIEGRWIMNSSSK
jgi:hypothetical protein